MSKKAIKLTEGKTKGNLKPVTDTPKPEIEEAAQRPQNNSKKKAVNS